MCVCDCACIYAVCAQSIVNGNSSNFAARLRSKLKPKEVNMKSARTHTRAQKILRSSEAEKAAKNLTDNMVLIYLHGRTYVVQCTYMENNRNNRRAERAVRTIHICKCCLPQILIQKNGFARSRNEFNSLLRSKISRRSRHLFRRRQTSE